MVISEGIESWGSRTSRVWKVCILISEGIARTGDLRTCLEAVLAAVDRNYVNGKDPKISSRKSEIPGEFHAKMGSIKDRNGMDLTEAEDIKKRWQEYTELYKKIFMTQIITTA